MMHAKNIVGLFVLIGVGAVSALALGSAGLGFIPVTLVFSASIGIVGAIIGPRQGVIPNVCVAYAAFIGVAIWIGVINDGDRQNWKLLLFVLIPFSISIVFGMSVAMLLQRHDKKPPG